jgi:hypothetical protein
MASLRRRPKTLKTWIRLARALDINASPSADPFNDPIEISYFRSNKHKEMLLGGTLASSGSPLSGWITGRRVLINLTNSKGRDAVASITHANLGLRGKGTRVLAS